MGGSRFGSSRILLVVVGLGEGLVCAVGLDEGWCVIGEVSSAGVLVFFVWYHLK